MKKILSLLLSVIIIFTCVSFAFASDGTKQTCPVILIPGFSSSPVYADVNDESTLLSLPGVEDFLPVVSDTLVPALARYLVDKDTARLTDTVSDRINAIFDGWFNESTGEAKEGSGIIPQQLKDVTKKSRLTFSYDWRGDPLVIADELNEYIETVCELSGCDKVALGCHSLGSNIALAYLSKYGNDNVSAIVYDSPAANGVALIGNLLTGQINLDAETLGYFLKVMLGDTEYKKLIDGVIDILESAGLFDAFNLLADEVIASLAPDIYTGTVAPLLGYFPTIWSMLPDDKVDDAKTYIIDTVLKDQDLSVLEKKIDNYNSIVRAKKEKTLKSFNKDGKFAIFSRYTDQIIPLKASSTVIGDLIIETGATSFGATTAPLGDYFSDEYLAGKNMKYISPDKTVDASTCLFPEQTWFIKGSGHFETGGLTENYYDMFFFSKKELTCDTAAIGRFTYRDKETYTLVEDTSTPQKNESPTFIKSVYNLAEALIETIKNLLSNYISF